MNRKSTREKVEPPDVFAKKFQNWITETMKYKGFGKTKTCPSLDDLKRMSAGKNREMWEYIIAHVRPASEVKKIRGNMLLSSNQSKLSGSSPDAGVESDDDLKCLLQRRAELLEQLANEEESLSVLENDLAMVKRDLLTNEMKLEGQESLAVMESCAKRLTSKFSEKVERECTSVGAMICMLDERCRTLERIIKNSADPQMVTLPVEGGFDVATREVDTKCSVDIRNCCLDLEHLICQLVSSDNKHDLWSRSSRYKRPDEIASSVEEVLRNYSADLISSSLAKLVSQSCHQLKKARMELLMKKAEKESKKITDAETFNLLLQDSKIEVMQLHLETEKLLFACRSLEAQNSEAEENLLSLLRQRHKGESYELAVSLYEVTKRLTEAEAMHSALEDHMGSLGQRIGEVEEENVRLEGRYSDMVDFKATTEANQNLISQLARDVRESRSRVKRQQQEVVGYVSRNLVNSPVNWATLVQNSKELNSKEVDVFFSAGLQNIEFLSDQTRVSIHRLLGNDSWPFSDSLLEIFHLLKFPMQMSLDEALPYVSRLMSDVSSNGRYKTESVGQRTEDRMKKFAEELRDLSQQVVEVEKGHVEKYSEPIRKRLANANQILESIPTMNVIVSDWWNQPGQSLVPWVKVDGRGFPEWLEEWKVTVSKLRRAALS